MNNEEEFKAALKGLLIQELKNLSIRFKGQSAICEVLDNATTGLYHNMLEGSNSNIGPRKGVAEAYLLRKEGFKAWPSFSGDTVYPVPSTHCKDPEAQFDNCNYNNSYWARTKYGDLRRELAAFLAEYFKENLWPEYDNE